jgi:hypothetical protein
LEVVNVRYKKNFLGTILLFIGLLGLLSCEAVQQSQAPIIVSRQGFIDFGTIGASRIVVGEILNAGTTNLRSIKVEATFYDQDSNVHATSHAYAIVEVLPPGEKAPFMFYEATSAEALKFELKIVDFDETDVEPYRDFEVTEQQSKINELDLYAIVGTYQNTGMINADSPMISATCYNSAGEVIGVGWSVGSGIQAGGSESFEVSVFPGLSASEIMDCVLQIDDELP